jgi:hypothetical protein
MKRWMLGERHSMESHMRLYAEPYTAKILGSDSQSYTSSRSYSGAVLGYDVWEDSGKELERITMPKRG